jgi:polysaccharide transporter, PST family
MSSRRLLIENIASLTVLQGLNYLAPLITLPYLVHVLQPSRFGLLSFAQGIVLYFDFFTDFGFNFSATRAIAECRYAPESISRIFWSTIYAKTLLMCISAAAVALLVAFTPVLRETPRLFAVNFLYVIGTTFFPIWLFQGLERITLAAALFGVARLLTVPALFLFVRHPQDYVIAGAIQASVELTASILAWPIIFKRIQLAWRPPSVIDIVEALKGAWPLFLSASAFQLSTSSITVILGFVAGRVEVGYFSAADKLIKASVAALNPLGQALYPHITAARLRSPASALELIRRAFVAVGLLSIAVSVTTALWARPICHLILGKPFEHSIAVLQCLSPLPLLFGLTSVFGTQTMLVFGMDAVFSKIMLVSAGVGLPITIMLSVSFGAVGAAVASVITAAVGVVAMWFALRARGMNVWQRSQPEPSPFANASYVREAEE